MGSELVTDWGELLLCQTADGIDTTSLNRQVCHIQTHTILDLVMKQCGTLWMLRCVNKALYGAIPPELARSSPGVFRTLGVTKNASHLAFFDKFYRDARIPGANRHFDNRDIRVKQLSSWALFQPIPSQPAVQTPMFPKAFVFMLHAVREGCFKSALQFHASIDERFFGVEELWRRFNEVGIYYSDSKEYRHDDVFQSLANCPTTSDSVYLAAFLRVMLDTSRQRFRDSELYPCLYNVAKQGTLAAFQRLFYPQNPNSEMPDIDMPEDDIIDIQTLWHAVVEGGRTDTFQFMFECPKYTRGFPKGHDFGNLVKVGMSGSVEIFRSLAHMRFFHLDTEAFLKFVIEGFDSFGCIDDLKLDDTDENVCMLRLQSIAGQLLDDACRSYGSFKYLVESQSLAADVVLLWLRRLVFPQHRKTQFLKTESDAICKLFRGRLLLVMYLVEAFEREDIVVFSFVRDIIVGNQGGMNPQEELNEHGIDVFDAMKFMMQNLAQSRIEMAVEVLSNFEWDGMVPIVHDCGIRGPVIQLSGFYIRDAWHLLLEHACFFWSTTTEDRLFRLFACNGWFCWWKNLSTRRPSPGPVTVEMANRETFTTDLAHASERLTFDDVVFCKVWRSCDIACRAGDFMELSEWGYLK